MASSAKLETLAVSSTERNEKALYGSVEVHLNGSADQGEKPRGCWGTRHTLTLMSFLGIASLYSMRVNLSVAIVAMTNSDSGHAETGQECKEGLDEMQNATGSNNSSAPFTWDASEQGIILASFFYGYIVTQIPGGFLAEKYGAKWFLGIGSLITAIFTLLTPPAAELGYPYLIAVRVLEGVGEGVTFPAMQVLISKWIPINERSRLGAIIWGGSQAGTVVALLLSGVIAEEWGWEWVFYFFGILGCVWFVGWIFLCFDTPDTHPWITQEERHYIISNIPSRNEGKKLPPPPLLSIMTTPAFLSLIVVHFGNNWGLYTLLTEIPTYLSNIQHFSLTTNGFLSALPYLLMWLLSSPVGFIADKLIESEKMKTVNVRRLAQAIAHYGAGLALIGIANVGCHRVWAIVCLCLALSLTSSIYSGFQVNFVELSPNYAGTLMGISNAVGTISGFVSPMVAGFLTNGNQTLEAWSIVFYLTSGIYIVFNTVFIIFADSSVQDWNTYWLLDKSE